MAQSLERRQRLSLLRRRVLTGDHGCLRVEFVEVLHGLVEVATAHLHGLIHELVDQVVDGCVRRSLEQAEARQGIPLGLVVAGCHSCVGTLGTLERFVDIPGITRLAFGVLGVGLGLSLGFTVGLPGRLISASSRVVPFFRPLFWAFSLGLGVLRGCLRLVGRIRRGGALDRGVLRGCLGLHGRLDRSVLRDRRRFLRLCHRASKNGTHFLEAPSRSRRPPRAKQV